MAVSELKLIKRCVEFLPQSILSNILCDVVILAKAEDAIRENTVELVIKESLSQRGIEADIEVT